jgi:hypothetical protein
MSCGTQPANISVINRRNTGSASLGVLEHNPDKNRWKTVGRKFFFLLTTVNHISAHPEIDKFGRDRGARKILPQAYG